MFKKFISCLLISGSMFSSLSLNAFADTDIDDVDTDDVAGTENFDDLNFAIEEEKDEIIPIPYYTGKFIDRTKEDICGFNLPEKQVYDAELVTVRKQLRVEQGEVFKVKVFLKNTGTMSWFSNTSSCAGAKIFLGSDKERDRASDFYQSNLEGWAGANRIMMDQFRTDPGQIASFTFQAQAPYIDTVYKEYFTPVIEAVQWIDDAQFYFETIIGDGGGNAADARKKIDYANRSGSIDYLDLSAEKSLNVDLSEQKLYVKLGDEVIREFRTSTGAAATPTPTGTTFIKLKQEVRIGGKAPHYIMPKFQWFRDGGFGFHALPSLGSSSLRAKIRALQAEGKPVPTSLYLGDSLWTEAVSHIGIPVSHGCIRLLPADADWVWDFTEIGTKVVVER